MESRNRCGTKEKGTTASLFYFFFFLTICFHFESLRKYHIHLDSVNFENAQGGICTCIAFYMLESNLYIKAWFLMNLLFLASLLFYPKAISAFSEDHHLFVAHLLQTHRHVSENSDWLRELLNSSRPFRLLLWNFVCTCKVCLNLHIRCQLLFLL